MKKSIILLSALLLPLLAHAMLDASEQALILNQELQFLEESAKKRPAALPGSRDALAARRNSPEQSLERTYFGEDAGDEVTNKTAAPKRRSSSM